MKTKLSELSKTWEICVNCGRGLYSDESGDGYCLHCDKSVIDFDEQE